MPRTLHHWEPRQSSRNGASEDSYARAVEGAGLKGLTSVIPLLMSGFAFAYGVGYFLAFDLAWFPFFSLSEHIVFAIRALPIALAAVVALFVAAEHPHFLRRAMPIWIIILILAAAIALVNRYLGLTATFAAIAGATFIHSRKSAINTTSAPLPYLVAHMLIVSLLIGYLSGNVLKVDRIVDPFLPLPLSRAMHVHFNPSEAGDKAELGHVIFVGDARILLYDYKSHQLKLYPWKAIQEVHETGID
jgi:hypothetical protein